ncbi:MAG: 3-dehydroquinate synthase [Nocardioidaceae bacterium]|jgi:3-dehydroquinate synthase|nr:3-dehydroquinate synthase [Nocardioidaceae bacterium]
MTAPTRIQVHAAAPYDVVIGHGLRAELPGLLGADALRVALIHPHALSGLAAAVGDDLTATGYDVHAIEVPNAEGAKTAEIAAKCWQRLGEAGFTRSDAVVGIGGGATTDLAGFVAATFLRGLTVVHLPTTLLGMVDAAVGGKTGINTAEGKNLVGAFHEPAGVLCDLEVLESLDHDEVVSGLAEVVKCGFIADARIIELVEANVDEATATTSDRCRELVERAIQVKADVVSGDLFETTSHGAAVGRESLNYGHTLAHAVERAEHYTWRHGDAVAVGLVYAAELGRLAGRLDEPTADRHRAVLDALGLPTTYAGADWPELHTAMKVDKKARGDLIRFVVLEGLAKPIILEGPDPALLTAAFTKISPARDR